MFIANFLEKNYPRNRIMILIKFKAQSYFCVRPLSAAWQRPLEIRVEEGQGIQVSVRQVLTLIQCTVRKGGNASELISQTRWAKILQAADKLWTRVVKKRQPPRKTIFFGGGESSTPSSAKKSPTRRAEQPSTRCVFDSALPFSTEARGAESQYIPI